MSLDALKAALPAYAKDLKLNVSSIPKTAGLSESQLWGTALSAAVATREEGVIQAVAAEARDRLSEAEIDAAKGAAAIMGMNNIYYRFVHLAGVDRYAGLPARLRMQIVGNPGVDRSDFELWCLAVSAIHGCGMCIESHDRELAQRGVERSTVQNAVRIASILHGVAVTLAAEESASGESAAEVAASA